MTFSAIPPGLASLIGASDTAIDRGAPRAAPARNPLTDYITRDTNGQNKGERLIAARRLHPHGARVLLRCIWPHEGSSIAGAGHDARSALAFEVLEVGEACAAWYEERGVPMHRRACRGMHAQVSINTVDRAMKDDVQTPFYFVPIDWIDGIWWPDETQPECICGDDDDDHLTGCAGARHADASLREDPAS